MKKYGLSDKLQNIASEYEGLIVAKILSQEKGLYRLVSSNGEKFGEISGKFYYEVNKKSEFPGVGDFVMADWNERTRNVEFFRWNRPDIFRH